MKRPAKPFLLLTWFLLAIFLTTTALCAVLPGRPTRAQTFEELLKPQSQPGVLSVSWYSAKRFNTAVSNSNGGYDVFDSHGQSGGRLYDQYANWFQAILNMNKEQNQQTVEYIAQDESMTALKNYDGSVYLGSQPISDFIFDTRDWVEADLSPPTINVRDNWVWGEVTGYIKMPETGFLQLEQPLSSTANHVLEVDGVQVDKLWGIRPPNLRGTQWTGRFNIRDVQKGEYLSFRFRVANPYIDTSYYNTILRTRFILDTANGRIYPDLAKNYYSKLSLQDIRPFFKFNSHDYSLTLDSIHEKFPVDNYEYGIVSGVVNAGSVSSSKGFQTLKLGVNHVTPDSGTVVVRDKMIRADYIVVATTSLAAPRNLALTRRTANTTSLSWEIPLQPVPDGFKINYDIYRRYYGQNSKFMFNAMANGIKDSVKVGSTTELTFIDKGLDYDGIYEYYVKAGFPTGFSEPSNLVRTDAVAIEGLPSAPTDLKVDLFRKTDKADLRLSWTPSKSLVRNKRHVTTGIKEYIIYRMKIRPEEAYQSRQMTNESGQVYYILGEPRQTAPMQIARTNGTEYVDRGLNLDDKCDYYVQAVDNSGIRSVLSSCLEASVAALLPPTKPGNLLAGDVLRQGDNVQYTYPDNTAYRNILMGPEREVALRWEPSTDYQGVTGYNIYRMRFDPPGKFANSPVEPFTSTDTSSGDDLVSASIQPTKPAEADIFHFETGVLLGSTKETSFVDKGLEFGTAYVYFVEAMDADGNKSRESIVVGTKKSTLAGLKISNDSQSLALNPAFAYYKTNYAIKVENAVKSIVLIPEKTDSQATVAVNGVKASEGGSFGPLLLDPGANTFLIEVVPRAAEKWVTNSETMSYTLKVNRANLANLPVLTLPQNGTSLNEGSTYKAAGKLTVKDGLVWTGTVDYGDATGKKLLILNRDGSFALQHTYLDNGSYKINISFRYKDLGLINGTVEVNVKNVAPILTGEGIKNEVSVQEGSPLNIAGRIVDPGKDSWSVVANLGEGTLPIPGKVNEDKTFSLQQILFDTSPIYDMVLKASDDDGGTWSKNIKIKVENVAPSVQAGGAERIVKGNALIRTGSFKDPGRDTWQATVDYGDGTGPQALNLKQDKTFDLNHTYSKTGLYTAAVRVLDQNGGIGAASFSVKVKDFIFTLEAGEDISLKEGDKLERGVPAQGMPDKIKSITVNYGDGSPEQTTSWSMSNAPAEPGLTQLQTAVIDSTTRTSTGGVEKGWLLLRHVYKDNGTFVIKVKIIDIDGDIYEDGFKAEVSNVTPTVVLESTPNLLYVSNVFTGQGRLTDPGADTWTLKIDYKDGSEPRTISVDPNKTFLFSHGYANAGAYEIQVVIQDDDGSIGQAAQLLIVLNSPGGVSGPIGDESDPHDAELHSMSLMEEVVKQNDGAYAGTGFDPDCLHYTVTGGMMLMNLAATAAEGAVIEYSNFGSPWQPLSQVGFTLINVPLTIRVTAADGVTTQEYTIEIAPPIPG
ncbi:MAG: PKD domain-containing protein [Ignavibacteriales bacterium]